MDISVIEIVTNQIVVEVQDPQTLAIAAVEAGPNVVIEIITPGPQGPSGTTGGGSADVASAVAGENIAAGAPLFVNQVDGKLYNARADIFTKADVVGLARSTVLNGAVATAEGNVLTLSDWTAIVGFTSLSRGADYFLGLAPGTLTTIAPNAVGQTVVRIGVATDIQTLALTSFLRILL